MPELQVALRYLVFAAFAASVLVALASWLVRTRRISPFGPLGRTLRAASDPLIRPIEARLVRAGGNPVHAGWWLAVAVAVAGVVFITLWNLLVDTAYSVTAAYTEGPRGAMVLAVVVAYRILVAALVGPIVGTKSCQVEHVGLVVSGRCRVVMDDGKAFSLGPGDLFHIAPGHDSWVEGTEPYVSLHFLGADQYAK